MHECVARREQHRRVVAVRLLAILAPAADPHEELSGLGELQDLTVVIAVARQPHVVLVVDEQSMLVLRPVRSLLRPSQAAPGPHHFPGAIELDHGRRRHAALHPGAPVRRDLVIDDARGSLEHPHVTVSGAVQRGRVPDEPVLVSLRPRRVDVESGHRSPPGRILLEHQRVTRLLRRRVFGRRRLPCGRRAGAPSLSHAHRGGQYEEPRGGPNAASHRPVSLLYRDAPHVPGVRDCGPIDTGQDRGNP